MVILAGRGVGLGRRAPGGRAGRVAAALKLLRPLLLACCAAAALLLRCCCAAAALLRARLVSGLTPPHLPPKRPGTKKPRHKLQCQRWLLRILVLSVFLLLIRRVCHHDKGGEPRCGCLGTAAAAAAPAPAKATRLCLLALGLAVSAAPSLHQRQPQGLHALEGLQRSMLPRSGKRRMRACGVSARRVGAAPHWACQREPYPRLPYHWLCWS